MKPVTWLLILIGAFVAVGLPAGYGYVAAQLPPLESRAEIEQALAKNFGEAYSPGQPTALPPALVRMYLAQRGCPGFLTAPRWRIGAPARAFVDLVLGLRLPGPGVCENWFAARIAEEAGAVTGLHKWVASGKIRNALSREQQLGLHLHSVWFAEDVVGVAAASRVLFRKELSELKLAELAELALTLPPFGLFDALQKCAETAGLRHQRNEMLASFDAVAAKEAEAQPVAACAGKTPVP